MNLLSVVCSVMSCYCLPSRLSQSLFSLARQFWICITIEFFELELTSFHKRNKCASYVMKIGVFFFAADNYRKVPRIKDLRLIFKKFTGRAPGLGTPSGVPYPHPSAGPSQMTFSHPCAELCIHLCFLRHVFFCQHATLRVFVCTTGLRACA